MRRFSWGHPVLYAKSVQIEIAAKKPKNRRTNSKFACRERGKMTEKCYLFVASEFAEITECLYIIFGLIFFIAVVSRAIFSQTSKVTFGIVEYTYIFFSVFLRTNHSRSSWSPQSLTLSTLAQSRESEKEIAAKGSLLLVTKIAGRPEDVQLFSSHD